MTNFQTIDQIIATETDPEAIIIALKAEVLNQHEALSQANGKVIALQNKVVDLQYFIQSKELEEQSEKKRFEKKILGLRIQLALVRKLLAEDGDDCGHEL